MSEDSQSDILRDFETASNTLMEALNFVSGWAAYHQLDDGTFSDAGSQAEQLETFTEGLRQVEMVIWETEARIAAVVGSVSEVSCMQFGDEKIFGYTFHSIGLNVWLNALECLKLDQDAGIFDWSQLASTLDYPDDALTQLEIFIYREQKQFLHACGYHRNPESLVGINQIRFMFVPPVGRKTLEAKSKEWGPPEVPNKGNTGHQWRLNKIVPIIREQFPEKVFRTQ